MQIETRDYRRWSSTSKQYTKKLMEIRYFVNEFTNYICKILYNAYIYVKVCEGLKSIRVCVLIILLLEDIGQ